MKIQKYSVRGTEINKIAFSEIEQYMEEKGFNVDNAFLMMADEKEFVYVSNGFVRGLTTKQNELGEWHHFFTKDADGDFIAGKFPFA